MPSCMEIFQATNAVEHRRDYNLPYRQLELGPYFNPSFRSVLVPICSKFCDEISYEKKVRCSRSKFFE